MVFFPDENFLCLCFGTWQSRTGIQSALGPPTDWGAPTAITQWENILGLSMSICLMPLWRYSGHLVRRKSSKVGRGPPLTALFFYDLLFISLVKGWSTACMSATLLQSCLTLWPRELYPARLLCPMEFSRQECENGLPSSYSWGSSQSMDRTCISCVSCITTKPLGKPWWHQRST